MNMSLELNDRRGAQWLCFTLVLLCSAAVNFCHLGAWPWDHDEVATLVELGLYEPKYDEGRLAVQFERLPKLVPAWYTLQQIVLKVLPANEFGTRVLSAFCGSLATALAFLFAWRGRSLTFALAIALLMGLNQTYVWLVQQNRFYSMGMLFLVLVLAAMWSRGEGHIKSALLGSVAVVVAVLSHNLVAAVLWIGGIAAAMCLPFGLVPRRVGYRAILFASVAFVTYVFYLRPLMTGWISGGTGGTNELVSFVAQLGIPTTALAGLCFAGLMMERPLNREFSWWGLVMIGGVAFIAFSPWLLGNWNPRYAIFFMIPFWVLGGLLIERIVERCAGNWQRAICYGFLVILLMPKFLSYWCDGSRHDFRTAVQTLQGRLQDSHTVYSDWPLQCDYYLRALTSRRLDHWSGKPDPADSVSWAVLASNVFAPLLTVPDYNCQIVEQIVRRRFDEQTHVIRIYRIWKAEKRTEGDIQTGSWGYSESAPESWRMRTARIARAQPAHDGGD